jgi:hypothetical protein
MAWLIAEAVALYILLPILQSDVLPGIFANFNVVLASLLTICIIFVVPHTLHVLDL